MGFERALLVWFIVIVCVVCTWRLLRTERSSGNGGGKGVGGGGWRRCHANQNVTQVKQRTHMFHTYIDDEAVAAGWGGGVYKLECGGKGAGKRGVYKQGRRFAVRLYCRGVDLCVPNFLTVEAVAVVYDYFCMVQRHCPGLWLRTLAMSRDPVLNNDQADYLEDTRCVKFNSDFHQLLLNALPEDGANDQVLAEELLQPVGWPSPCIVHDMVADPVMTGTSCSVQWLFG